MYGVKLSQENKNEDFAEWAEKENAKKKKATEKEATLAEKQNNADNSNLTNRKKYSSGTGSHRNKKRRQCYYRRGQ